MLTCVHAAFSGSLESTHCIAGDFCLAPKCHLTIIFEPLEEVSKVIVCRTAYASFRQPLVIV